MKGIELRKVKQGQMFTLKPLPEPREEQVWIRNHYDRASKTYSVSNYADVNRERFLKPNRIVFTDFIF
jgi:hypothetical protein